MAKDLIVYRPKRRFSNQTSADLIIYYPKRRFSKQAAADLTVYHPRYYFFWNTAFTSSFVGIDLTLPSLEIATAAAALA